MELGLVSGALTQWLTIRKSCQSCQQGSWYPQRLRNNYLTSDILTPMKMIPLSKDKTAFVDDSDFELLSGYRWFAIEKGRKIKTFYAVRHTPKIKGRTGPMVYMHTQIMGTPKGMEVDHKDKDALNNQRSNLRLCTRSQNCMNRSRQSNNTSGYKGVSWFKPIQKWRAYLRINSKHVSLGYFADKEDAHKAYIDNACMFYGEFMSKT